MSIQETYPIQRIDSENYIFESRGGKGIILKMILYQPSGKNKYNLAFGDIIDNRINDGIVSNNNDVLKVISTVAKTIYDFTASNPEAVIEIKGVDEKRTKLYNSIFRRRFLQIRETFHVVGIVGTEREDYNSERVYEKFEVQRKIS